MKKWNGALTILLAAGLAASLCGCGGSADSSAPPSVPASQAVADVPTPEPTPEPTPTPEPELHGLLIVEHNAIVAETNQCIVRCLNPETGEAEEIFRFGPFGGQNDGYYMPGVSAWNGSFIRAIFSEDFSKIICAKQFSNGGGRHAGWIDTEGNFFDVTEALGLQAKSDFEEPASYSPIGFCNGLFGFVEAKRESPNSLYVYTDYYVPLDNISPEAIQKGDVRAVGHPFDENEGLLKNAFGGRKYTPADVTSWIDGTHCIVTYREAIFGRLDSFIVDVTAQTESVYIPGNSRDNWSGIISPDGTKIAFLSVLRPTASGAKGIYIVPVNGGDPVKVNCSFDQDIDIGWALIDWI